jgi:hypothetical protein
LRRRLDIALEKDEPKWIAVAEEVTLLPRQHFALAAADEGTTHGVSVSRTFALRTLSPMRQEAGSALGF